MELGDVDKSLRAIDRYAAVAAEFRQSRHLWPVPLMRAMYATAQGRGADAARLLAEARAIAASDPEPIAQAVLAWHALAQVVHFERVDEVDAVNAEHDRSFRLQIGTHGHIAETMLRLGRIALLARFGGDTTEVNRLLDSLPWEVGFLHKEPTNIISIAEPIAIARNTTLAALLHPAAVAAGERVGSWGRTGFVCTGPAERARALFAGTLGRHDEAIDCLERAATRNQQLGFRLFLGDVRCWQAHYLAARRGSGDEARARAGLAAAEEAARAYNRRDSCCASPRCAPPWSGRARGCAGVTSRAGDAALPARRAAEERRFTLTREGDYWAVTDATVTVRIRDARGMQMLAELIAAPRRDVHALALMGADGDGSDSGDAGELLDKEAIAEYRARLRALEDDLSEAESWNDAGRAARARAERDAIAAELARGVGLGGRGRRASAAAERARVNVQRRIRGAIKMIGQNLPALGAYLEGTVKTGTFCSYEPF